MKGAHGSLTRQFLARAEFLLGDWRGKGIHLGGSRYEERLSVHMVLMGAFLKLHVKAYRGGILEQASLVMMGVDEDSRIVRGWWFTSDGFQEQLIWQPSQPGLVFLSAEKDSEVHSQRMFLPDDKDHFRLRVEMAEGEEPMEVVREVFFTRLGERKESPVFSLDAEF